MVYMGSKARISKAILPIILANRKEGQMYYEPFVGGCNMIDKVSGYRIAADNNKYLIAMWQAMQQGWVPPEFISKEQYFYLKENKEEDLALTCWAGFCCSYGGKWFGGYVSDYPEKYRQKNGKLPNRQTESRNSVLKQFPLISNVVFLCCNYWEIDYAPNSLIYCDPPYKNTTGYKDSFDHASFWYWVKVMTIKGHQVFVSEYSAPPEFTSIFEMQSNTQLANGSASGNKDSKEKIFIFKQ